jgi:hypothetical protein
MPELFSLSPELLKAKPQLEIYNPIGNSEGGRPIQGFRFGHGPVAVSLIAGHHGDEPVGPELLTRLINVLKDLPPTWDAFKEFSFCIIPHANPDAAFNNAKWWQAGLPLVDHELYSTFRVRELPGRDMEFGYANSNEDPSLRTENQIIAKWYLDQNLKFAVHASLHGMAYGDGPWYLIEKSWASKASGMMEKCVAFAESMGYKVHDVDRKGEKGFYKLAKGFSSRPDSKAMQEFFMVKGDPETAAKFMKSSMEFMCQINPDCLNIVSEMPLFIMPAQKPMLVADQIRLQWDFICNALSLVKKDFI